MGFLMLRSDYSLPLCVVAASGPFLYHPRICTTCMFIVLFVCIKGTALSVFIIQYRTKCLIEPRQGKVRVRFSPSPLVLGGF